MFYRANEKLGDIFTDTGVFQQSVQSLTSNLGQGSTFPPPWDKEVHVKR